MLNLRIGFLVMVKPEIGSRALTRQLNSGDPMPGPVIATIEDAVAGGFGVIAALCLIGGGVFLHWQRTRYQFELMQKAMEKGLPPVVDGPPAWLVSLRQAVGLLVVGIALVGIGLVLHRTGARVAMPAASVPAAVIPATTAPAVDPHPRPDPALERWHRGQDEQTVGLISAGSGIIVGLLGLVQIGFSFAEKKYTPRT
jgi:hypothetical protein